MSSIQEVYLRIAPDRFHFLKFILEGYDNLAVLSSVDMKRGIVRVRYPSDLAGELYGLLSSIASKIS